MKKTHPVASLFAALVIAFSSAAAKAEITARWDTIAADTAREAGAAPAAAEGGLAAVRQAMAAALGGRNGNGNGGSASHEQHREAAVAVAAFAVLETLYPSQRENLDAQLALALSYIPETAAKAEGAALGRRVATEIIRGMAPR